MQNGEIHKISSAKLFSNINPEDLQVMLGCINPKLKSYAKGEIVALSASPLEGVGIVLDGEVEIARENAAGSRLIMAIAGSGHTFGEMAAFSGKRIWPATVTARKDSRIVFISPDKFSGGCEKSCASHKRLIQNMLCILSEKALYLNRKVEYLTIKSMRVKIASYLLEQSRIYNNLTFIMPMNKNELADFLNVSRPSMSREFSRLKEEGIIDFYLSSIRLINADKLKEIAKY